MKNSASAMLFNFLKSIPSDSSDTLLMDRDMDKSVEDRESQEKKVIICAFCSNTITDASQIISVNGSHQHAFANPHGIVFDTGCFKQCDGCIVDPTVYAEFSWFHGYNWQVAGCSRCRKHLGWLFVSGNTDSFGSVISTQQHKTSFPQDFFYCLILEHIIIPN